ncbi:hypothetical protein ACWCQX_39820, partial [Streptomyces sp. NPDC002346]
TRMRKRRTSAPKTVRGVPVSQDSLLLTAQERYRGQARMLIDLDRDTVAGVTFAGPGVGELLHSATIAVAGEVPIDRLWHAVPAFPTISEVWLRLLEAHRG